MNRGVIVGNGADGGYFGIKDEGGDRQDTIIAWGDNQDDNLRFIFTKHDGEQNGKEVMRINASGNVGIGTSSPGAKLHIEGGWVHIRDSSKPNNAISFETQNGFHRIAFDQLRFFEWNVGEIMAITDGKVGIGTTVPKYPLDVHGDISSANINATKNINAGGNISAGRDISAANIKAVTNINSRGSITADGNISAGMDISVGRDISAANISTRGNITADGNIKAIGNIYAANHPSPSDARLKKDIQPLEAPLGKLARLRGVSYQWKDEEKGREREIGVIAQEMEKEFPELVSTDDKGYKSVAYGKLTAVLMEAMKEQQKAIEAQQSRISRLEAELEELRDRIGE